MKPHTSPIYPETPPVVALHTANVNPHLGQRSVVSNTNMMLERNDTSANCSRRAR